MSSSLPVSLVTVERRPLGRPSRLPSLFFRAKASLVREEIMERSISAEREKAKANTFELMIVAQFIALFGGIDFNIFLHEGVENTHHLHEASAKAGELGDNEDIVFSACG